MTRFPILATFMAFVLTLATPVLAHEAAKGRNGGLRVDAGRYHTELVTNGTTTVVVHLSDADDKPISSAGFKAVAILVVDGKSERVLLEPPADGTHLIGTAPASIAAGVKGVVQLTAPDGSTVQAKF